ncbi:MAG TPA: TIR-like protein FxsC [Actinoplanes sp.]
MTSEFENEDPAAPIFFLSYWRPKPAQGVGPPREATRFVTRFFDDLTADVNDLIGSVPGRDPGFLDVAGDGGVLWRRRLLHAVGTCHVFICLLSAPYLHQSEWCAREWDLFARRSVKPRVSDADPAESAIVPVLWTPLTGDVPEVVADVNYFVPARLPPDDRAAYRAEGMLGLLKTGQENVYQAIVWRLAQHVERIRRTYRVEPLYLQSEDDLRTTFERGGS